MGGVAWHVLFIIPSVFFPPGNIVAVPHYLQG